MKKVIVFTATCLLVVLAGIVWGIYDYGRQNDIPSDEIGKTIMDYLGIDYTKKPVVVKPPPPPEPPKPVKPPEPPKPPVPLTSVVPSPVTGISLSEAKDILREAENNYSQLNFSAASQKLAPLLKSNVTPEINQKATDISNKSIIFNELLKSIPPDQILDISDMVELRFMTGQILIAKLVEETKTTLRIRDDKNEQVIQINWLASYTKLNDEEYQNILRREYKKRLSRLKNPSGLDYYNLARYCYRSQLKPETLAMLELALEKDKDIVKTVLGGSVKPPPPDVKKQLAEAEEYYNRAVAHFKKTQVKGPDFNEENKKARQEFRQAREIYSAIRETYRDDEQYQWIEDRLAEIIDYLTTIRKQMPVDNKEVERQLKKADEYFKEGKKHLEKTMEKGPDFSTENQKAIESFEKARDIYVEIKNAYEDTEYDWLESRFNETIDLLRAAKKQRTMK